IAAPPSRGPGVPGSARMEQDPAPAGVQHSLESLSGGPSAGVVAGRDLRCARWFVHTEKHGAIDSLRTRKLLFEGLAAGAAGAPEAFPEPPAAAGAALVAGARTVAAPGFPAAVRPPAAGG